VDDPSIKQSMPAKATPQPQQVIEAPRQDEVPEKQIEKKEMVVEKSAGNKPEIKPLITKSLGAKSEIGQEIIYIDNSAGKRDTITIIIPMEKPEMIGRDADVNEGVKEKQEKNEAKNNQADNIVLPKQEEVKPVQEKKEEAKFLNIELPRKNEEGSNSDGTKAKDAGDAGQKALMINSDCQNYASEDDFLKLRKKMVAADNEEAMIVAAKKTFKSKCFTTEQIRNLGVLFLKDAGKYSFFDAAYPFVSDSGNYSQLQSQLTEVYYLERFKAMIRH
jgi:hypothetical protein